MNKYILGERNYLHQRINIYYTYHVCNAGNNTYLTYYESMVQIVHEQKNQLYNVKRVLLKLILSFQCVF